MYCKNCGKEVNNQAAVCVSCGVPVGKGNNYCQNCGDVANPSAEMCVKCGTRLVSLDNQKSKLVAGLLGIFIGSFGVHRFYLGYTKMGIIQIVATVLTCGIAGLWGFIEGILIIAGSTITTDAEGRPLKD